MTNNLFSEADKKTQPSFSFTEAADILGVSTSTVSHAVSNGRIETVNTGGKRDKIPASEVIQYGIKRRDLDGEYLREEIHNRTGANDEQITKWLLIGLGLYFAYQVINGG